MTNTSTTYYVETIFYPHHDPNRLITDHSETECFGDLESARKFAREWASDDDTHQAVIWQAVESVKHPKVSDE